MWLDLNSSTLETRMHERSRRAVLQTREACPGLRNLIESLSTLRRRAARVRFEILVPCMDRIRGGRISPAQVFCELLAP